jgi:hypothetical protein
VQNRQDTEKEQLAMGKCVPLIEKTVFPRQSFLLVRRNLGLSVPNTITKSMGKSSA